MRRFFCLFARILLGFGMAAAVTVPVQGGDPVAPRARMKPPHTVIDAAGRTIVVKGPFKRIISLYGAHTENLFQLGLEKEIIGVGPHADFPPAARTQPVFSYHDDPEKFLVARPDLILVRPMIDRGYPRLIRRLEKSGITVVSLQPATVPQMYTYWEILGMLTGRTARAAAMVRHFKATLQHVRTLTASLTSKKKVYFEAIHSKMKTFAPQSMAIFVLEAAGGVNVAADAEPVRNTNIARYGKERILAKGEKIDVYLAQYGAMNRPTVDLIKNEPGFQVIRAVRENQIFIVNEQIVSRPTLRLLEGVQTIGRILYPGLFKGKPAALSGKAAH